MNIWESLKALRRLALWGLRTFPSRGEFGAFGVNSIVEYPMTIDHIKSVFVESNVTLRDNLRIVNAPHERVVVKQYSVLSSGVTIITNTHRSTVGIPHFLLGPSHINDKSADVQIDEDVWVGANATILAGVRLGRGCVVAAGAVVTKSVPPYALVAGTPARIVKRIFSVDQIIKHEQELYPPQNRFERGEIAGWSYRNSPELEVFGTDALDDEKDLPVINNLKKELHYVDWKG